jgi:hypothetical protein
MHHSEASLHGSHVRHKDVEACSNERIVIFNSVLFTVEHDEIRGEPNDLVDLRVFGTTDVAQRRLFTEPSAGHDVSAER